jgi:hypothetical protein
MQRYYRLLERPSNANTAGNMHEELGESNNAYENILLNFARQRGLTPKSARSLKGRAFLLRKKRDALNCPLDLIVRYGYTLVSTIVIT